MYIITLLIIVCAYKLPWGHHSADSLSPLVLPHLVCQSRVLQSHDLLQAAMPVRPHADQEGHCPHCGVVGGGPPLHVGRGTAWEEGRRGHSVPAPASGEADDTCSNQHPEQHSGAG